MKEKILFITYLLPFPLDNGGKIKTYNTLKALKIDYDIDLICFIDNREDRKYVKDIESLGIHVDYEIRKILLHDLPLKRSYYFLKSLLNGKPYIITKFYSKTFAKNVNKCLDNSDYRYIYIDTLRLFQYVPKKMLKEAGNKVILDQHNVECMIAKRFYEQVGNYLKKAVIFLEHHKLRSYEKWACKSSGMVLAITDHDKEILRKMCGNNSIIRTSPSYIETNSNFRYSVKENSSNINILFVGTMSWYPNEDGVLWFYKNAFLKLKEKYPDIKLDIVGSKPRRNILKLKQDSSVNVTGYVGNINPYWERALISVVPIRIGGGMRIKILQLLALGVPIVTTSIGCEGISVTSNKEVLIADSEDDIYEAIGCVINDANLRKKLSANSLEFIKNNYSIESALKKYEQIFNV